MREMMTALILLVLACQPLAQSSPITVGQTSIQNNFPNAITFQVTISSSAGTVESVDLVLRVRGASSAAIIPADFTPGSRVTASVTWDPKAEGIPPGAPVEYQWSVRDGAGNSLKTGKQEYVIIDARFKWQSIENDQIALWWYEGDQEFGQHVFEVASRAMVQMEHSTRQTMPHRAHIVLYPDQESFASWHRYIQDWVGGQAYPPMGLTVQIIPPDASLGWIDDVVPHEIAHIFFYQITYNPLSPGTPTWLEEGFAEFYEFSPPTRKVQMVRQAVRDGSLIPLRLLTGTFSGDDRRIALMYAEGLSAVQFLYERWGEQGLADLLAAYREGLDTDEALLRVTGLDFEGFQLAWWEWLGGTPGMYPTPVVWAASPVPAGTATPVLPTPLFEPATPTPQPAARGFPAMTCDLGFITLTFGLVIGLSRRTRVKRRE